jgi:hypothetical protein
MVEGWIGVLVFGFFVMAIVVGVHVATYLRK